jgi:hypothetical protein
LRTTFLANKSYALILKLLDVSHQKNSYLITSPTEETIQHYPGGVTKEGHNSSDVSIHFHTSLSNRTTWELIPSRFKNYFEGVQEFVLSGFAKRMRRDPKWAMELVWRWGFQHHPFQTKDERWIFVIDSLSSTITEISYNMAEDEMARKLGYKDRITHYKKTKKIFSYDDVLKLAKEIEKNKKEQILLEMEKEIGIIKVSDHIWINEADPGVMIIDETLIPFDMKNGWSPDQLAQIVEIWFDLMFGLSYNVKNKK